MKNKIYNKLKLDKDERTSGDGFYMYNAKNAEDTTNVNKESAQKPNMNYNQNTNNNPNANSNSSMNNNTNNTYNSNMNSNSSMNYNTGNSGNTNGSKTKKPGTKNILIIVLALIVGLAGGFGGGYIAVTNFGGGSSSNTTINTSSDMGTTEAVAQKVLPSVVGITATTVQATESFLWGPQEQEVSGVGTGIIVDKSGYILTNSHVVMDSEDSKLTVLLSDSSEVSGTVEWLDATLDLAIVKINATGLTAVDLGDSDDLNIGQYVAAIGNPLGLEFQGSVTQGVISGLDRTITASSDNKEVQMEGLIQVDAAINSGNSGGPLLNEKGEVIGINTAKASGEGMGFAIPINTAKPIIESIKETGEFSRAYMGVSIADLSQIEESSPGEKFGTDSGAYIVSVTENSPAEKAGLKAKDIIVAVDGKEVDDRTELINHLLNYKAGDTIEVKYYRDGTAKTAKVKLTSESQG